MNIAISKLDTTHLRKLMCLDPDRIVAKEATPEAIEACRLMGVELLLSPDFDSQIRCWVVDADYLIDGSISLSEIQANALYEVGRKLGVSVVFAQSDTSGLKAVSAKEAEQILAKASGSYAYLSQRGTDSAPVETA